MPGRGRRPHSRPRRPTAPRGSAGAPEAALPRLEYAATLGELQADEAADERSRTAGRVPRRMSEPRVAEPLTLSDLAFRRVARDLYAEVDPLDEVERILAGKPQLFRFQFFAVATDRGPAIVVETEIRAADASAAIRAAADVDWPPRAIGLRVLDDEGFELFERLKADRR